MTYQVLNPATGQLEQSFQSASDTDITDAIDGAHQAFGQWSALDLSVRVGVMNRVAELLDERAEDLAAISTTEMGKATAAAVGEVRYCADIFRYYAEQAPVLLADEQLPSSSGEAFIRKSPIGPLLGIMPWNPSFSPM